MKLERIRGGWSNVPSHLKCLTDLKKMGLKPTGEAKAEVWNNHIWVKLYDINESVPKKAATEKQLKAIEKARAAQLAARTCSICGDIVSKKADLTDGICETCWEDIFFERTRKNALETFRRWIQDKSQYLILDTETTGLDGDSEIIEIALIDLDENILFESLVKPLSPIPEEVIAIHGITNDLVVDAPTWPEVWPQIQNYITGKTILIYNADFDARVIRNNCKRHNLTYTAFETVCVMETYAKYIVNYSDVHHDFTWISLIDAARDQGIERIDLESHRAKADCITCARLIKKIASV